MIDGYTNRVDLVSGEGSEEWLRYNKRHFPCKDPMKVELPEGILMIHRPGTPNERKLNKIIRPSGESVKYESVPNCGLVVKVHEDSLYKVGEYVFWTYAGYDAEKPQPISYDFSDHKPTYFFLKEKHILGKCPPDETALEDANENLQ